VSRRARRGVRSGTGAADAAPALFTAAAASYTANAALGASVALRLIDTRNFRWVHHALYIATFALSAAAFSSAWWGRPREATGAAAATLAPAFVPLAIIPYAGTHTRRHPLIALTAAPFVFAAAIRSRR
jgi:hypothetical protein